jgi:hypothetical protein
MSEQVPLPVNRATGREHPALLPQIAQDFISNPICRIKELIPGFFISI